MEIEDVTVKFSEVRKAANEFNETGLGENRIKTIAVKKKDLFESFMAAVESTEEGDEEKIPEDITALYNEMSKQLNDGEKEECPVYEKGWNPENKDCKACLEDFPGEYGSCEKATKKKSTQPKKAKSKKEKRTPSVEKKLAGIIFREETSAWHIYNIIKEAGITGISPEKCFEKFTALVEKEITKSANPKGRVTTVIRGCRKRKIVSIGEDNLLRATV
jgi:hypothetical protein